MTAYSSDNDPQFSTEEVFVFPTSFAQSRLWFLNQLTPDNPFYNVSTALRLVGTLNLTALEQTFNKIIRRHETLRTTFTLLEGQPVQVIAPTLKISIPIIDLTNLPISRRETEAQRLAAIEAKLPFDLTKGPLLRVKLIQLDISEYVLLLNLHHIVADGWSIGVLVKELSVLYTAYRDIKSKVSTPLPDLPIQYADYAQWQRDCLQDEGQEIKRLLTYWQQQLDGISVLNLPTDRPRPTVPTYKGAKQFLELPHSLSAALEVFSHKEGVTLFITLLAAFQTLLYRYTEQEDIAVGSAIANRNRSEIEGLIGFFVNSLVLRTDLSGNPTFRELLSRVRDVAMGAYAHQDLPFEKLVQHLHPQRDLSRNPLFQVSFSFQNTPIQALELPELTISLLDFEIDTARLDLEFHLWQSVETQNVSVEARHASSLHGQVIYSTDLFEDATITRMLGHFQMLLESIIINPEQRISELPILTTAEKQQLLINWNNISVPCSLFSVPARGKAYLSPQIREIQLFHQLFEEQVKQTPLAVAIVFENQQLTYRELNIKANQVAHYLQQLGVVPDVLVGICLERSLEMIVALLGILKAGGAYLPIDPSYPQKRLQFMLEDASISILLTHSSLAAVLKESCDYSNSLSVIYLDTDSEKIAQYSQENQNIDITPNNLAYVIYTSGSTGKPKGVLIEHRGLANMAKAQVEVFNLQPTERILQFASLSFDASIFEIVMALATGASLYLARKESLLPGQVLIQLLRDRAITIVTLPPAVLAALPTASLPALHTIIAAGEICPPEIVKRWANSRKFFNAYGPTEATVWTTIAQVNQESAKLPIGRPIPNTQVYILDRYLQPVPIGVTGELYISGHGLARGYLNRPDLTADKFIPNPFIKSKVKSQKSKVNIHQSSKIYKTGDLARYLPDGNIEFLGRIDEQVKIRGFRIELGEIEAALHQHLAVREAVAIAFEDVSTHKRLVAYIVPNLETLNVSSLQDFLKKKLPEYMVPSTFIILDSLPLTGNGKVDRRALPAPNLTNQARETAFVAPRNTIEEAIAKIWSELLKVEQVSIHDNFFTIGGDSLLTISLLERINQQFKQQLPLSELFLNPTVAGLAHNLSAKTDSLHSSPLVPIQPHGSKPPFFCVHPILGIVFPYYELAYTLGADQPFYGLQSVGIDGKKPPLTRIEDMAADYIEALRTVQPQGPYFIGGWSFGGWIAFEMAQQLQKSGQEVALLALFDTLAPIPTNKPSFWDSIKFMFTTVGRYIWPFVGDYLSLFTLPINKHQHLPKTPFSFASILGKATIARAISQESRKQILNELTLQPILKIFSANSQATLNYIPQTYQKQITLFKAEEQTTKAHQNPTLGWSELAASEVKIHLVPGNHLNMLKKPHVQVLSEKLKEVLITNQVKSSL